MSDDFTLDAFSGTARLFPLPNVVLFPHVMQPLHIFEPRYREMTADALGDDRLLALVLLRPGWEEDYEGRPTLHDVDCLGRIVAEQRFVDGRYNLLLRGLSRVRLVHEVPSAQAYRSAKVEVLCDTNTPDADAEAPLRAELAQQADRWFEALGLGSEQLGKLLGGDLTLGTLADILSFALPLEVAFKQELLEELDVGRRVQRLLDHLRATDPPRPVLATRKFPPEFSAN